MRVCASVIALATAAGVAGCGSHGRYQLTWCFTDMAAGQVFTARDCGAHGVDAFALAGGSGGDRDLATVPCGALTVTRSVPPGHWTFLMVALGRDGLPREPGDATTILRARPELDVVAGETASVEVAFDPQPQCRDGVDNDDDGAVDLADADCHGDPEGAAEATAPAP